MGALGPIELRTIVSDYALLKFLQDGFASYFCNLIKDFRAVQSMRKKFLSIKSLRRT